MEAFEGIEKDWYSFGPSIVMTAVRPVEVGYRNIT